MAFHTARVLDDHVSDRGGAQLSPHFGFDCMPILVCTAAWQAVLHPVLRCACADPCELPRWHPALQRPSFQGSPRSVDKEKNGSMEHQTPAVKKHLEFDGLHGTVRRGSTGHKKQL
eukprot:1152107-Pelagomonas_calceolata.AAC.3